MPTLVCDVDGGAVEPVFGAIFDSHEGDDCEIISIVMAAAVTTTTTARALQIAGTGGWPHLLKTPSWCLKAPDALKRHRSRARYGSTDPERSHGLEERPLSRHRKASPPSISLLRGS